MSFSQLNKLTLLANLAFLASLAMRFYPILQGTLSESTILVTGLLLSVILNVTWLITLIYRWGVKNLKPDQQFITILNGLIILVQLYLLFSGITHLTEL
jgi:ABC-type arginine/histidine transport system permease subunit